MLFDEHAVTFACQDDQLMGILSLPQQPARRGVLVVVGGPQYRVGSHRQFTLLARSLAAQGIAVLRFDYRGMGDSEGAARDFAQVDADLRAAVDFMTGAVAGLAEVVVWGLCDAASAALFYAATDARVVGLVLLNPWARTTDGLAKATLKHYYRGRLLAPGLWRKIAAGKFDFRAAVGSLLRLVRAAAGGGNSNGGGGDAALALPERMLAGLAAFHGKVLLILCPIDLTAQEFLEMVKGSAQWQQQLAGARVTERRLAGADHTFSRQAWRDQVAAWTAQWISSW
ncbi:MAG: hydrolase 1, exosortase A system-associated [Pseudomonadota bacterium]|nr:hydrolase 1, exosortase A system-associated [Pseudomonadota bacterium]MDL2354150.1 hydrolase 1, exosortase A system-associated [Pseudomonadota bacterium]